MLHRRIRAEGGPGRVAGWLLVFALAVGVAAMHVFGHPDHLGQMPQMPQMAGADMTVAAPAATLHHDEPSIIGTRQVGATDAPAGDGMDPSAVCLAVLIAALLLPGLRRSFVHPPASRWHRAAASRRSPGPAPPSAPSLQKISVLRL